MGASRYVPSVLLLVPGPWRRAHGAIDDLGHAGIRAIVGGLAPFEQGSVTVDLIEDAGVGAAVADSLAGELPSDLAEKLRTTD